MVCQNVSSGDILATFPFGWTSISSVLIIPLWGAIGDITPCGVAINLL